jgi:hypothetical protein
MQNVKIKLIKNMKRNLLIFAMLFAAYSLIAQAPTIESLATTGTGVKWYDAPTGGNLLPSTTVLINGQHYYASQTINGCESTTRLDVVASVITVATPVAGTHAPSQTQIVWNWNTVTGATGYKWNTINTYGSATDLGNVLTSTETGLTCNIPYTRYIWAYNASGCVSATLTLTQSTSACEVTTSNFDYTGSMQTFTVPSGITTITIEAWGGQGANTNYMGGAGGYAKGDLSVTPGEVINIYVGGMGGVYSVGDQSSWTSGGWNGGGLGYRYGRGGGGASDVRIGGTALANRVIVAAGGGGASNAANCSGGVGGGTSGSYGLRFAANDPGFCGQGGTQSSGGAACINYGSATSGYSGQGGNGGTSGNYDGTGGGGGYFGGGGGDQGGAGGGSSYTGGVNNSSTSSGARSGNGQVKITY